MPHFTTYTGVRLPLKLLNPLSEEQVHNRNTYFSAYYDGEQRLVAIQKMVYGEVELTHRYDYKPGWYPEPCSDHRGRRGAGEILFDGAG